MLHEFYRGVLWDAFYNSGAHKLTNMYTRILIRTLPKCLSTFLLTKKHIMTWNTKTQKITTTPPCAAFGVLYIVHGSEHGEM